MGILGTVDSPRKSANGGKRAAEGEVRGRCAGPQVGSGVMTGV